MADRREAVDADWLSSGRAKEGVEKGLGFSHKDFSDKLQHQAVPRTEKAVDFVFISQNSPGEISYTPIIGHIHRHTHTPFTWMFLFSPG